MIFRTALKNEGSVEGAVEKLTECGGFVTAREDSEEEKQRDNKRARRESEDREAYGRIKEGISEHEEDHLDLDLVEEGQLLKQYLGLLQHVKI